MRVEEGHTPCYENTLVKKGCCLIVGMLGIGLSFSSIVVPAVISRHDQCSDTLSQNRLIMSFSMLGVGLLMVVLAVAKLAFLCRNTRAPATPITSYRKISIGIP